MKHPSYILNYFINGGYYFTYELNTETLVIVLSSELSGWPWLTAGDAGVTFGEPDVSTGFGDTGGLGDVKDLVVGDEKRLRPKSIL